MEKHVPLPGSKVYNEHQLTERTKKGGGKWEVKGKSEKTGRTLTLPPERAERLNGAAHNTGILYVEEK